jgi:hypothetical protein
MNADSPFVIAGPHISAYLPIQEQLDAAQNTAIEANTSFTNFWTKEWQPEFAKWQTAQNTINTNQKKWNDASTDATKASLDAIRALARIDIGGSLVPYMDITNSEIDAGVTRPWKPTWASNTNIYLGPTHAWVSGHASITEAFGVNSATKTQPCQEAWTEVNPETTYKVTYYDRATVAGSRYYIQMKSPTGETNSIFLAGEGLSGNGTYLVSNELMSNTGWTKREFKVKFNPNISKVSFHAIFWNHPNSTAVGNQYIAGLTIVPDVPSQAELNEKFRLTDIDIKNLIDTNTRQDQERAATQKIADEGRNKAIAANTEAVKALGKIDIGASLVAYRTLTKADIDSGQVKEYMPLWATCGNMQGDTTLKPAGYTQSYGNDGGYRLGYTAEPKMVSVSPGQVYKMSFWEYGTGRILMQMSDSATAAVHPVKSMKQITGYDAKTGARTYGAPVTGGWLLDFTFTGASWTYREFEVEFKPGVEQVRFYRIYWNYGGGTTAATQRIAGFDVRPDIPTQAQVDQLQNESIKKTEKIGVTNTTSIELLQQAFDAKIKSDAVESDLWSAQDIMNKKFEDNDRSFIEMQKANMKAMTRFISGPSGQETYNEHMRLKPDKKEVEFYGGWTGPVTFLIGKSGSDDLYIDTYNYNWVPGASTILNLKSNSFDTSSHRFIVAIYQVNVGVQKSLTISSSSGYLSNKVTGSWVTMAQTTAPVDTSYFAKAEFQLKHANRGSEYGMRITVNGTSVLEYRNNRIGPVTSLGSGTAYRDMSGHLTNLKKGDTIKLEGLVNGAAELSQAVDFFRATFTYIDSTGA